MADRSIVVRLRAEVADFKRQMNEAAKATDKLPESAKRAETSLGRMVQSAQNNREAWDRAGGALTAFGAATLAGLGLATKAAIDWESAWTGVLKTVEGSDSELAAVEDGLRNLTRVLPASHQEIAAVAEAAGQLGISTGGILSFTETMINLGETTNLSADEAATALARVRNIMGDAEVDVSRMGATIVDLGNNSATTEREITDMGLRLAAAGKQAGLSTADVFAFASALTSVGVEAEAGGTAMSKVFTSIADAARDGGDDLETFARVSGVSVAEFRRAFETDAAGAVAMFVEGMGRAAAAGESTTAIFDDLELADERLKRAILSTGSATGLLGEQLEIANGAWADNDALLLEASKRYETTEAQIQLARNAINDTAITLGETFLPMIASASQSVASFAEWVGALPDPVLRASGGLAAIAGTGALAAGSFLLIFPRVMDTVSAFRDLRDLNPRVASGLGKVGKAAGGLMIFAAVATAVDAFMKSTGEGVAGVERTTQAMLDLNASMEDLDGIFAGFSGGSGPEQFTGVVEAMDRLISPSLLDRINDFSGEILSLGGNEGSYARTDIVNQFKAMGDALALMVDTGNAERAAEQFAVLEEKWVAGGGAIEDLQALMPAYDEALARQENQADLAGDSQNALTGAYEGATEAMGAQIPTLEELIGLQAEAAGVVLSEREAQRALQAAIDDATASIEANGVTLDITTAAGRRNQEALDEIAKAGWDLIESMQENGATQEELQGQMGASREAFLRAAAAMGIGADEANALADELGLIPKNVTTTVDVVDSATATLDTIFNKIYRLPDSRTVSVNVNTMETTISSGRANQIGRASGGIVYGPGTSTSDSIPARLSNGEYVIKTAAVQRYGKGMFDELNSMRFAVGGYVGAAPASSGGTASAAFPDTVTLVDASGALLGRMQVVASGAVSQAAQARSSIRNGGVR